MSEQHHNPLDHAEVQVASAPRYLAAFVIGFGLMALAALILVFADLSLVGALLELSIIGFVAIVIQLYLLFKLDIHESRIWHTISFVMTVPLLFIAITLTQWMFHTLAIRTALGGS
ncbi:hypothetical protein HKX42_09080 [Salinisphaera sp. USBA-960]|uniref:hypothetical protein n=1 Tax=Salinisphaera orenii TaxID=856731 RepID=UPI000DBE6D7A|nr:hypothetical protein [Salifodinibacter halophilus]NNC27027.1 hypothetical protein [Salifodinibacter halophilus]